MNERERTEKDLVKLKKFMKLASEMNFDKDTKYKKIYEHCLNYFIDAKYYFEKNNYFSSLGCSNYAYGMLESILLLEKGKYFHEFKEE